MILTQVPGVRTYKSCIDLDNEQQAELAKLLHKHSDCFSKSPTDLGITSLIQHEIDTGDAQPVKSAPRRPPMAFAGEEEKVIQQQLDAGVLRPSTSPWASALVYVRKKCGGVRACVDYRRINNLSKKCAYPLPKISECLDCLGDAKFFSTLDMQSGYWQIEVKESDRPKTAIVTRGGLYEYVTMPFGLCGAPATFTRCMELIFRNLQWKTLLIYIDDLIILSPSISSHLEHLEEVFSRLKEAGLKLKPSKCNLLKTEVAFLGHIVTQEGVKTDPTKVEAIRNWPVPKNLTEIRSFLGITSYYRRFIQGYAHIAQPLNQRLEAGQVFSWNEDCQAAFEKLKEVLISDQVMAYPKSTDRYVLDTDASNTAIGATLSQIQWDEKQEEMLERPVAYASKTMTKTQRRYCTTRRELLAVVFYVWYFRHYLLGREFLIRTDHSARRWVMTFKEPEDQMARWIEILTQFIFKIVHRSGKKHVNADSLSRIPSCDPDDCNCYDGQTILEELPCGGCDKCLKKHDMWSDFPAMNDVTSVSMRRIHFNTVDLDEEGNPLMAQVSNEDLYSVDCSSPDSVEQDCCECDSIIPPGHSKLTRTEDSSSSIKQPTLRLTHLNHNDDRGSELTGHNYVHIASHETTDEHPPCLSFTTRIVKPVTADDNNLHTNHSEETNEKNTDTRATWIEGYSSDREVKADAGRRPRSEANHQLA
jgi:hypothetical protein